MKSENENNENNVIKFSLSPIVFSYSTPETFFLKRESNKVFEADCNLINIFFFDVVTLEIIGKRITCSPCE